MELGFRVCLTPLKQLLKGKKKNILTGDLATGAKLNQLGNHLHIDGEEASLAYSLKQKDLIGTSHMKLLGLARGHQALFA